MSENEGQDQVLPAPLPGGPDPEPPLQTIQPDTMATHAADDQSSLNNGYNNTVRALRAQPLVRIRIPKESGPQTVKINGWYASYAAGEAHMVPQQVAELLEEAGRI